jgi:hypothetical protein
MNLWTKRCLTAVLFVGAAWILGPGAASATAACDNGGMIGSGTITC